MRLISVCLTLILVLVAPLHTAQARQAAISSAHPAATDAGFEILEQGGNAFDAAVAVSAVLAVVEPYSSGIGGGGFWLLYRNKDGKQIMIDGREKAPYQSHRDMYLDSTGEVIPGLSVDGPLSAGIPGEPAALVHIAEKYGKLSLHKTLAPAIRAARNGFKVTPHYQRMAQFRLEALRKSPAAAKIFLLNNEVPPLGYVIKQEDLAKTLEAMAKHGRAGFYEGEVARRLVTETRKAGGIWSMQDLAKYQIVERKPLTGHYRGYQITSAAPPSSGGIALLEILHQLEGLDLHEQNNLQRKHLIIEAMRRAYRDRAEYLGDPDFVKVPIKTLLSKQHADQLRKSIDPEWATPSSDLKPVASKDSGFHTTHFSIIDKHGNRVAATLSINYPFGSCYVPPGTGVLLNDEMDDFSAKPGVPNAYGLVGAEANAIAPGKRMLSSMSPTFVENKQRLAVIGTPGGSRIITMVLHGILAFVDGKDAETIVNLPRYHHQYLPDMVQHEVDAFSAEEKAGLEKRGHQLKQLDSTYGNMHIVIQDKKTGKLSAAGDKRGEGKALVK
ncbi:MAG: gamma-glutamyltransferase [Gammaproteobacteria bacterium]|nr:gamma-glutamyltransferase [Gammaproteobacteria bacterium]MDH5653271.1 gamma-glutamyltransferase [Gammaproteobacteria bacterium]